MSDFLHPDRVSEVPRTTPEMARKASTRIAFEFLPRPCPQDFDPKVDVPAENKAAVDELLRMLGLAPRSDEGPLVARRWERR